MRDVTEHREAEASLRDAEARYQELFENASDMVYTAGLDGRLRSFNRAAERLTGYSRDELFAMSFMDLVAPEYAAFAAESIAERISADSDQPIEVKLVTKDGGCAFAEVTGRIVAESGGSGRLEGIVRETTERHAGEEALRYQALHDHLTGLPNRLLLLDRLDQANGRAERDGSAVAALLLDVDDFKVINDSLGHAAGDELLVEIAARLAASVRTGETVARLGGDEFALVAEDTSREGAEALAARVQAVFAEPFLVAESRRRITGSLGIALSSAPISSSDLIRDADVAMYRAKASGKGRFEFFDTVARTELLRHLALGRELQDALSRCELEVHYQPIVSVADGQVLAVEALARWMSERWGRIRPEEFIPLAEENGLIVPLGRCVLEAAARQVAEWRHQHPGSLPLGVFVNISLRELAEEDFAAAFTEILTRHGLSHGDIALELTERVFIEPDSTTLARNLTALSGSGTRLVLDDFGTGYSSLGALKRFPLAAIKIDRSFIQTLRQPDADAPVARAAVALGKSLGLIVVAEGVEDDAQLTYLRRLGCDAVQGFLLARPQQADTLSALIALGRVTGISAAQEATQPSLRAGKPKARSGAQRQAAALSRRSLPSEAPIPLDDLERLAALRSYDILDTEPEPEFDDIARLAAEICRTPMAFVSLVDQDREFFKAAVGGGGVRESPRDISFSGHAIVGERPLVVPDALQDTRFAENPNVIGGPRVRSYAGVPLITRHGYAIGTLCVKDTAPRKLNREQLSALEMLAHQVLKLLELHRLTNESQVSAARAQAVVEKLSDLTEQYELLFDGLNAGVLTTDLAGRITHANPAACRELGYTEHELRGQEEHALLHHSYADGTPYPREDCTLRNATQASLTQDDPSDVLWRKDGSSFEIEYTAVPLTDNKKECGTIVLFRNVGARKVAERELRDAKALYQALVDNSRDMIALTDSDGIFLFASKSHEATLGYTPEELIGQPISMIVDPRDFARGFDAVAGAIAGPAPTLIRGHMVRKDGSSIPAEGTVAVIPSEDGSPPVILTTNRDLSARYDLESGPGVLLRGSYST